jgi:hypothetical protein
MNHVIGSPTARGLEKPFIVETIAEQMDTIVTNFVVT